MRSCVSAWLYSCAEVQSIAVRACVRACVHVNLCACVCTYMHVCTPVRTPASQRTCVFVCVHASLPACIQASTRSAAFLPVCLPRLIIDGAGAARLCVMPVSRHCAFKPCSVLTCLRSCLHSCLHSRVCMRACMRMHSSNIRCGGGGGGGDDDDTSNSSIGMPDVSIAFRRSHCMCDSTVTIPRRCKCCMPACLRSATPSTLAAPPEELPTSWCACKHMRAHVRT